MNTPSMDDNDRNKESATKGDDPFSGRGSPAFMSLKEPAIRMLRERYAETFALTVGRRQAQIHLFLVKLGMWALVFTFAPQNYKGSSSGFGISQVLEIIELAMSGKDNALKSILDSSVESALARLRSEASEFNWKGHG
ncbi:MAG: hypothetical protein M1368_04525 [Thaumarchaeota archaeon]|nr:hypothetical protein [Nitrososphaerota archaeon]